MDYSHNGTGKHRPRASHARHTSSESHRSDWDLAETFEQHPLPYRDRRRSSNNQVPDEGRMPGYYPPSPARPRRASDVPPARGHDSMPHTPQSAGPRTGRAAPGPRSRIPESSTRAPSAPRRVIEASEEDESEEETEDSDDDSDEDEQDIIPRSRAASRATSQLRRGIVSRAASPESEASKDTTLSIEIATAPRTSGPRSRPVSRAVSRVRSSRRPSFRESDADVETDSDAESGSDVSSDAAAPPHGPSQVVSRRKQIQGAPATTSALVPAKRTTPVRKQPKAAYDLDDSDCSDLERLRSRQQPPEIQIARYASPTREHRRHHSDPKRPSRKQHLSPEPRSGLRRTPASPKVYYSSQSSANNFHRSHTAPSSYVTSRSAPTRRSTSTRRSSTWIESHHTLQAEPGMNNARSVCHNCKGDEYLSRRLDCRHRLCSNCLQETFRNARGEGSAALPTCYCGQPINTEMVESVMPLKFRSRWNKHYATQMAQLRVFCPIHFCGVWIPPQSFDQKQRTGQCPQCQIHVCLACHQNMKAHKKNKGCPAVDKALLRQQKDAQTNPTRFCGRCQGAVPLSGDHPHMECDGCQTQTCAACDSKWRSCRCPWFVDERDLGLQGSQPLHRASILEPQVPEVPEIGPPPRSRRLSSSGRTNHSRTSHQHQEDRRRRQHDRAEKAFTQQILYDEPDEFGDVVAIGNIPGHFMPDDYRRGHETLIEPPSPPLHHPGVPFDRAEPGANYISGVNRARGVNGRGGSMERLAERFSEQRNGGSPAHRSTFAPMTIQPSPSVPRTMATPPLMMPMTGPPIPHLRRHHTVDDELPSPRMPIDRIPVRRRTNDFPPEEIEYPSPSSRSSRSQQSRRREPDMAHSPPAFDPANPASAQAGLTGEGRGAERVKEWRTYVEPKRRGSVTASG